MKDKNTSRIKIDKALTPESPYSLDGFYGGYLLIATPNMMDERFRESVIFMFSHSLEGAMGIIINKPVSNFSVFDLLKQFDLNSEQVASKKEISYGGPVEIGRGFILHSSDYIDKDSTLIANSGLYLTSTVEVLKELGSGFGPKKYLIALGYSGWSAGQLEKEIEENSWLVCRPSSDIIFNPEVEKCWEKSLVEIGINRSDCIVFGGSA